MPDAPVAAPTPAVPAAPALKSGWKTTEAWLAMLALGGCGWVLQQLVAVLPELAKSPGVPSWAAAVIPIALVGVAWVAKLVVGEYGQMRKELKLGAGDDVTNAVNAGAAVAIADSAATAAVGNR